MSATHDSTATTRWQSLPAALRRTIKSHQARQVTLDVAIQGAAVKAKGKSTEGGGGGERGQVLGFSDESRRRLGLLFASLPEDAIKRSNFITLTLPDEALPMTGQAFKRLLDTFGKRFLRRFPSAALIWKMEPQTRKSGELLGDVVPHLHLIAIGDTGSVRDLRLWAAENWFQVVGTGLDKHFKAGTQVIEAYGTARSIAWYVSKYAGKRIEDELARAFGWAGRYWGVIGRANLPEAPSAAVHLSGREVHHLKRYARRWLSTMPSGSHYAKRVASMDVGLGFSLMGLPAASARRLIDHAIELAGHRRTVHVNLDELSISYPSRWSVEIPAAPAERSSLAFALLHQSLLSAKLRRGVSYDTKAVFSDRPRLSKVERRIVRKFRRWWLLTEKVAISSSDHDVLIMARHLRPTPGGSLMTRGLPPGNTTITILGQTE